MSGGVTSGKDLSSEVWDGLLDTSSDQKSSVKHMPRHCVSASRKCRSTTSRIVPRGDDRLGWFALGFVIGAFANGVCTFLFIVFVLGG